MKKLKITKREILFFFIGLFTMLTIDVISDWNGSVASFKKGYNEARNQNIAVKK